MKVLIAIDDSPHSERAVDFVARMRWPAGSRVIVLGVAATRACASFDAAVARARSRLRACGICAEGRVLRGEPREELVAAARDERADLLVLGSRGRGGLARLVLGSVSSHAVHHAGCSVLVVKQPDAQPVQRTRVRTTARATRPSA